MKIKIFSLAKQVIKFSLVGLSNTLIGIGLYSLLVYIGFHYQVSNITAFIISSLNGFILNKFWVFTSGNRTSNFKYQILKYYLVYGSSLLIGMALLYLWIDICKVNVYLAPFLNLFVTIPFNYLFSKFWVYKHSLNTR